MDPVLIGGLLGIGGTVAGALVETGLSAWRDSRAEKRRRRRAVFAVLGELHAMQSIFDKALESRAWWPPGDAPQRAQFELHQEALVEAVEWERFEMVRMACESVRSLEASRLAPAMTDARPLFVRLIVGPPSPRDSRDWGAWPDAEAAVRTCFDEMTYVIGLLLPVAKSLGGRRDRKAMGTMPPPPGAAGYADARRDLELAARRAVGLSPEEGRQVLADAVERARSGAQA